MINNRGCLNWNVFYGQKFIAHIILFLLILPAATIVLISAGQAFGEEKRLSIRDAIKTALSDNHELRAAGNALSASGEDVGIARGNLLPRLTFEERFMRTANPTYAFMTKLNQERIAASDFNPFVLNNPNAVNDFQSSISFEQPIFARQAYVGLDMAKIQFSAGSEELKRKKEELA